MISKKCSRAITRTLPQETGKRRSQDEVKPKAKTKQSKSQDVTFKNSDNTHHNADSRRSDNTDSKHDNSDQRRENHETRRDNADQKHHQQQHHQQQHHQQQHHQQQHHQQQHRDNIDGRRESVIPLRDNAVELSLPPAPKSKTSIMSNSTKDSESCDVPHDQPVSTTK